MNSLYVDTRDNSRIIVRLKKNGEKFEEVSVANKKKAQVTLPLIEKILKKASLEIGDIDQINVEKGPGSFTGIRVGISIANALSFAGSIKVNGKKLGEIELPQYQISNS
ncbi:MAG: tRNA (adenosine(37)-N6)-threonylcarbamoyltransferase complex dimerization subunit type 1 TsaB, partial [Candidatus Levybacteria bacterium]|nr:tRNA (adenosine(37)-N6)-threonylcarbamoyltransferase complex dimerization subunit type 1 TsaB [Candidatus Levybacteria bacterium]